MSKSYIMSRPDLADTAAVQALVDGNPAAYAVGAIIVPATGIAAIVKTNDGTTVVLANINA